MPPPEDYDQRVHLDKESPQSYPLPAVVPPRARSELAVLIESADPEVRKLAARLRDVTVTQEEALAVVGKEHEDLLPEALSTLAISRVLNIDLKQVLGDTLIEARKEEQPTQDSVARLVLHWLAESGKAPRQITALAKELLAERERKEP